ncbi:MbcA/ParS/Xre antitoxin family protein [Rhodoblastus sp.]|jgi:hypothetical protein|uniref:MbcA/ParS/Xre antitoxin family protein n=1 Tax=Rhodoblastus sp. TaxID=1962975 RepID=UPI0025FA6F02|nr:MbcA/ParS/Xre antitoxin family protein [Rhodoblastus sp.]
MTSKRRMRRIRGKMRSATVAKSSRIAGAEYGPDSIAVLAALAPARRRPDYFITPDMSDEARINVALRFIFRDADRANAWLKTRNDVFGGQAALDIMSEASGVERVREYLESEAADGIEVDSFGRRLLSQKGSIPADVALEIDDPRRAGPTSEMPDDPRALALEGLQAPYEADADYGPKSRAVLEDLAPPADRRHSFSTFELSEEQVEAIKNTKMDPRHDHLDASLEDDFGRRLLEQKGTMPPDVDLEI